MTPVMGALREVHNEGILHRDISPDNIYITRDRTVKLLDFGAVRHALGEACKSLYVILKPGYAPEEQYRAKGKQGPWTDIYAVAATLYHVVSGQLPLDALDRFEEDTFEKMGKMAPNIPSAIEEVVMRALAVRSKDRYATMAEFQEVLGISSNQSRIGGEVFNTTILPPVELISKNSINAGNDSTEISQEQFQSLSTVNSEKSFIFNFTDFYRKINYFFNLLTHFSDWISDFHIDTC